MLIKALCDYYDCQKEREPTTVPKGYQKQPVSWRIHLTADGEIASVNDYREEVKIKQKTKNKDGTEKPPKIKKVPTEIALPERSQKTAIDANIIEHRPLYLFGLNYVDGRLTPEDATGKAKKSHDEFVKRNLEFFEDLDSLYAQPTGNLLKTGIRQSRQRMLFCWGWEKNIQVRITALHWMRISRNRHRRMKLFWINIISFWQKTSSVQRQRKSILRCVPYWESGCLQQGFTIRSNFREAILRAVCWLA